MKLLPLRGTDLPEGKEKAIKNAYNPKHKKLENGEK